MQRASHVSAIIVTYMPALDRLQQLLAAISPQVERVIVVDNGSRDKLDDWLAARLPEADFVGLGFNSGIARAQNVGIDKARANGANHVLLLDQDSIPAPDMVARLVEVADAKRAEGIRLASIGPRYEDSRMRNPVPFIRVVGLHLERANCSCSAAAVDVDYLIASGCLIPMATLDAVGGMCEELFIDYVDIEWGLRAQQQGFRSFGACAARMNHALGSEPIMFGKRAIPVHSPLRHYYHFRNAVWLYRQRWLRTNWKIVDAARLVRKFTFYSLMTPPRLKHAGMMALGIAHGLTGHMGPKR